MRSPASALLLLGAAAALLRGSAAFVVAPSNPLAARTLDHQCPIPDTTALHAKPGAYGEESRKYRRTVYGYDDWVRHRAPMRSTKNVKNFFSSGIYRQLVKEVGVVVALSTFVVAWNGLFSDGYVDFAGVSHEPLLHLPCLSLPLSAFSTTGSFLGLLLAFRTNQAYKRWDEARKCWGLTINHTRNVVRKSAAWASDQYEPDEEKRKAAVTRVAGAVWSFPRSLKRHLYSPDDDEAAFQEEVRGRLPPAQAEALIAATHRPNRALFDIACAVNDLPMHFIRRDSIDKSVTVLIDQLGGCERLFSSPVPLFYTRHTARFLTVWMFLLPFGLYEPFKTSWNHWAEIPAAAIIAVFLFGIEELSVQLEEPFTILPLQVYSERIGNSIGEIAGWHPDVGQGEVLADFRVVDSVVDVEESNAKTQEQPTRKRDLFKQILS